MTATLLRFLSAEPSIVPGLLDHALRCSLTGLAFAALLTVARGLTASSRRILAGIALAQFVAPTGMFFAAMLPGYGDSHLARASWCILGWIWLLGAALVGGAWLRRGWKLGSRLRSAAGPISELEARAVAAAADAAGLRTIPACLSVTGISCPSVVGFLHPVVVLPRGADNIYSIQELTAVLVHEFVHIRRRDPLWNLLQTMVVSAFWFSPVVWLLHRRLSEETEGSCDEGVLAADVDRKSYANGIIKSLSIPVGFHGAGITAASGPPVTARIAAILLEKRRIGEKRALRTRVFLAGLVILATNGYSASTAPTPSPASFSIGGPVADAVAQLTSLLDLTSGQEQKVKALMKRRADAARTAIADVHKAYTTEMLAALDAGQQTKLKRKGLLNAPLDELASVLELTDTQKDAVAQARKRHNHATSTVIEPIENAYETALRGVLTEKQRKTLAEFQSHEVGVHIAINS